MTVTWDGSEGSALLTALGERLSQFRLRAGEAVERMRRSLERHGQLTPVAVWAESEGQLQIVDGVKRVQAARALGWSEVRVRRVSGDALGAKLAVILLNEGRGLSELEEAWRVRSLYREEGLSQPRIGQLLGRDKAWVSRRLALAEGLEDAVEADVRLGLLSARAAAELARLSRDNQVATAEVVVRRGLTCSQTAGLVHAVLACPDAASRCELVRDQLAGPLRLPGCTRTRRPRSRAEEILSDVAVVTRSAARLQSRLGEPVSALGERAAKLVLSALSELAPVIRALGRTLERQTEEVRHVQSPRM
jgi:ParB-like chromosome segregation protein Spo0J